MKTLATPALENLATAPASPADRRWSFAGALAAAGVFAATLPFARTVLTPVPAFIPSVVGAGVLALFLTAVLFFVQYRIERDPKLALLALAYAHSATNVALYVLTFPGLFAARGLLGAGPQTASFFSIASQVGFGGFLIAEGLVARGRLHLSGAGVRALALVTLSVTVAFALAVTLGHAALPLATEGTAFTPLWARVVVPFTALELLVAFVAVAGRLHTVTEVWFSVVLIARVVALLTAVEFAAGRYSFGWYAARIEEFVAAAIMLSVFFVKINEVMLRLAAGTRSSAEALAVGEARYASLANVVPQLIWTTDRDGTIEYVNDRWIAYTGCDLHATRAGGWSAVLDPEHEHPMRERWRESVRTGESFAGEYRLREGATGSYRWFLIYAVPARDARGAVASWIGTCTDVDRTKRLEERETFLAHAGERLGASLDVWATVAALKSLLIPRLAERIWVALVDDDGTYVLTALGSTDLTEERDARVSIGAPLQPDLADAVAAIVAGGDPVVLDEPARFPDPWIAGVPPGGAVIVPLVGGKAAVGALALVRTSGAYDAHDVSLIRDVARRCALALDHARLYERERTTADALQRAMLPAQLPHLPDIRFSASYSAASESQRVGGDFYDAFELPDGRVALTIGDVTGHGLEAAVIMGEIRQALRAAAFESADPSAILDRASRLLLASGRTLFVTAIFGVLDPVTGRFAYATAGHPPPILADGAGLRRLSGAGLPIGLRDGEGVDFALRLHAPCTLVMFTDGLMEFGRDLEDGERRIDGAIRALAHQEIEHLAGALMQAVLGEDAPTDDIAILTVSIDRFAAELPGDEREWDFTSGDARTGALVRNEIGDAIAAWTGDEDAAYRSELAFGELVANVVQHAPGPVHVVASSDVQGRAALVVEDSGHGFDPVEQGVDPYAESGRGLRLVRGLADAVKIEPTARGGSRIRAAFGPRGGAVVDPKGTR